jgi:hypothetical protein
MCVCYMCSFMLSVNALHVHLLDVLINTVGVNNRIFFLRGSFLTHKVNCLSTRLHVPEALKIFKHLCEHPVSHIIHL